MDAVSVIIVAVVIVLISICISQTGKDKRSLPGPTGLPFVGYLPFMTKKPYEVFQQLAKKYGPVYKIQLGGRNLVILCDFKSIKEAFADDAFMGRPHDLPFDFTETTKRTGGFFELGWKEQRKFCLQRLRDLGFGKTRMEVQLEEEMRELLDRIKDSVGKPIKMSDFVAPSTSNNIASLLFGKRLKFDDPRRMRADKLLNEAGLLAGAIGWQILFTWIGAVVRFLNIGNSGKLKTCLANIKAFCRKEIAEHERTLDPNNIRDLIDAYIIEIQKNAGNPKSTFQKDTLVDLAQNFFGAGSDTVRITIDWLTLVSAAFPKIQDKVHHEIDEVVGRERFPSYQDRLNMPYTEAVILEVMRWRTIIPINVMRCTLKDTELNGYFIPKNSDVLAIFYCQDHDENIWGKDVHEYKPERFLSEDGKKVVKPEHLIPFSIGKRQCPGKTLAEIEVFLYFVAILQKFKLSMPSGKQADFEGVLGIGLQPKRQDICPELR